MAKAALPLGADFDRTALKEKGQWSPKDKQKVRRFENIGKTGMFGVFLHTMRHKMKKGGPAKTRIATFARDCAKVWGGMKQAEHKKHDNTSISHRNRYRAVVRRKRFNVPLVKRLKRRKKRRTRPYDPFMYFAFEMTPVVRKGHPKWHKLEVGWEVGRLWRGLSPSMRAKYEGLASKRGYKRAFAKPPDAKGKGDSEDEEKPSTASKAGSKDDHDKKKGKAQPPSKPSKAEKRKSSRSPSHPAQKKSRSETVPHAKTSSEDKRHSKPKSMKVSHAKPSHGKSEAHKKSSAHEKQSLAKSIRPSKAKSTKPSASKSAKGSHAPSSAASLPRPSKAKSTKPSASKSAERGPSKGSHAPSSAASLPRPSKAKSTKPSASKSAGRGPSKGSHGRSLAASLPKSEHSKHVSGVIKGAGVSGKGLKVCISTQDMKRLCDSYLRGNEARATIRMTGKKVNGKDKIELEIVCKNKNDE